MTSSRATVTCPDCGYTRETRIRPGSTGRCSRCSMRRVAATKTPEQRKALGLANGAHQATVRPDVVQRLIDGIPGNATRAERQAAAKELAAVGIDRHAIATRIGIHPDSVARLLRRTDDPKPAPAHVPAKPPDQGTAIEQAIARGLTGDQIMTRLGVGYEDVWRARRRMEVARA